MCSRSQSIGGAKSGSTDKSIIADLPDKTEVKAFCHLTRKQAALYQAAVAELEENLKQSGDGIARRGLVLSSLMRLKQICNHPSQWLGDGAYDENDSGKFERLREIGETVGSRQEKLLVFTQFKEIIPSLERLLAAAFGRPGLALHGIALIALAKMGLVENHETPGRLADPALAQQRPIARHHQIGLR